MRSYTSFNASRCFLFGLAGARVDDGLLGEKGEADRGKEGLGSGTFRSCRNSRTAKPVLRQVLLTGGKEEE